MVHFEAARRDEYSESGTSFGRHTLEYDKILFRSEKKKKKKIERRYDELTFLALGGTTGELVRCRQLTKNMFASN